MTKWEYSVKKYPINDVRQATDLLTAAGGQGWELVWATQSNQDFVAVLKREQIGYTGPREKRLVEVPPDNGETGFDPIDPKKRGPGRPPKNYETTTSVPGITVTSN